MRTRRTLHLPRGRVLLDGRDYTEMGVRLLTSLDDRPRGRTARRFEEELCGISGRKHAVLTGSGKAALILSLEALPLPRGSEVLLPAFLVPEVASAISAAGYRPRIIDVEPDTFGPDLDGVRRGLKHGARAILAAHLFGTPCRIRELSDLARTHDAFLIEDAAQAIGARVDARGGYRPAGSFGDLSYASFGLFKNVYALFGGVVLTDDDDLADKLRTRCDALPPVPRTKLLREWLRWGVLSVATNPYVFSAGLWPVLEALDRSTPGASRKLAHRPDPEYASGTLNLDRHLRSFTDAQARLGLRQLARVDRNADSRASNADALDAALAEVPGVRVQRVSSTTRSIRLNYVVCVPQRERVLPALRRRTGLDLAPGYLRDLGGLPAFERSTEPTPCARWLERSHFYVPIHHRLPDDMPRRFAEALEMTLKELDVTASDGPRVDV